MTTEAPLLFSWDFIRLTICIRIRDMVPHALEQVVLTNIRGHLPTAKICFYRDSNGNELDFVVRSGTRVIAVECKCSSAPTVERGTYAAMEDVRPDKTLVVAPAKEGYPLDERISVANLSELPRALTDLPTPTTVGRLSPSRPTSVWIVLL